METRTPNTVTGKSRRSPNGGRAVGADEAGRAYANGLALHAFAAASCLGVAPSLASASGRKEASVGLGCLSERQVAQGIIEQPRW